MEIVEFGGWKRNAKLVCNDVEMIVTLEVGPRVIYYGFTGGPNEFVVHEKDLGHTGGDDFHSYGGHRLWIAPEEHLRTLRPDNDAVEYKEEDGSHVFTSPNDEFHMQKEIRIKADTAGDRFILDHRIYNNGAYPVELAVWAPTQCAGGSVLFPQAPFESHDGRLLPTRPIVMWGYTKIHDPRWTWGDRVVRLRHDTGLGPQKVGTMVEQGYAACANNGHVFLKRFPVVAGGNYPDFGCNFETFTRFDMIEIESLGPMVTVPIGEYAEHRESWYLIRDQEIPDGDDACAGWLDGLAALRPL